MLQPLEVLGVGDQPWSSRCWSRSRRALTCSTSASALRLLARSRSSTRSRASRPGRRRRPLGAPSSASSACSGSVRALVRELVEPVSSAWRSSSAAGRTGRLSARCSSLGWRGRSRRRTVHGSVTRRAHPGLHRIRPRRDRVARQSPRRPAARSTRPPSARRRPAPAPPCSRNSDAGWWRRSAVT